MISPCKMSFSEKIVAWKKNHVARRFAGMELTNIECDALSHQETAHLNVVGVFNISH